MILLNIKIDEHPSVVVKNSFKEFVDLEARLLLRWAEHFERLEAAMPAEPEKGTETW